METILSATPWFANITHTLRGIISDVVDIVLPSLVVLNGIKNLLSCTFVLVNILKVCLDVLSHLKKSVIRYLCFTW